MIPTLEGVERGFPTTRVLARLVMLTKEEEWRKMILDISLRTAHAYARMPTHVCPHTCDHAYTHEKFTEIDSLKKKLMT